MAVVDKPLKEGPQYWGRYCVIKYIEDPIRYEPRNIAIILWNHDKSKRATRLKFPWMLVVGGSPWYEKIDPDRWEESNGFDYEVEAPRATYIGETDKDFEDEAESLYKRFVE